MILIPALNPYSPAERALHFEGLKTRVRYVNGDDYVYAEAVQTAWSDCVRSGEDLIILEHDIVPWVGAMQQLYDCKCAFCAYRYPIGPGALRHALGCVRFNQDLINSAPTLLDAINHVPWNHLDAEIYRLLVITPHLHGPPLAHVKGCTTPPASRPSD